VSSVYILSDNGSCPEELSSSDAEALLSYNGQSLGEICRRNPKLLAFPYCLGDNGDDIGNSPLFWLTGKKLNAGNTVGFWGFKGVHVRVHSRFDMEGRQYFFHYMLQRVCGINVLNLQTLPDTEDSIWEFLMYLFPMVLKNAMKQGVYNAYRRFQFDDARVRGTISLPEFIRRDIPFCGRIAYATREHTSNNAVMHLVRHTIEYIRRRRAILLSVDADMRAAVSKVMEVTSDYSENQRQRIIAANLRPLRHPFYTSYTTLQTICLRILRHEKLTFGVDDKEICGIVFDAAWLWEEYLNTIFRQYNLSSTIAHPRNKKGTDPVYFYKVKRSPHYPDFYDDKHKFVLDAKYKHLQDGVSRDDLFQLISYLHVLGFGDEGKGVLLYPARSTRYDLDGELCGSGGRIGRLSFAVPFLDEQKSFFDFVGEISCNESIYARQCAIGDWDESHECVLRNVELAHSA